ncbi:amidohydrolase [Gimibacter soli]|uniref:5-methylthioadenosine/S-adenosylhomocysteine deaminase n=1 Tax=Gimibacter soli TaxID=3024400 RepID=A0AAE9XXH8_9PROT|nr:amidohydrolase [Gimibacter soli]WCL55479.1 amidohydrolase [Gimibacter soli]
MKKLTPLARTLAAAVALVALNPMKETTMAAETADMIVLGDYVVTMDDAAGVIEHGAVAVKDGAIVAVGKADEIKAKYTAKEIMNGDSKVLMPGLVNGHTHTSMTLLRGVADDLDLMTWLTKFIFPMEGRFVDPEFVRIGTSLACWEMIRGGTTSFVDMYFYPEVIAGVVEECGLRAVVTAPMIDFPSPGFKGWEDSFAAGVKFVESHKGKSARVKPGLAPHAPYTVSKEHLAEVLGAAKKLDVPISIHVAEDQSETKTIADKYGMTSIELLSEIGYLDHPVIAAHVVWPSEHDRALMAKGKMSPIHNPTSNLKTGAGIAPVPQMLDDGITLGLATDGAASNNDLDMWEEIRFAALLHKGNMHNPTVVPALSALKMATSEGAKAATLGDVTGKLVPGLRADMIQVDLTSPRLAPLYDVISHLVYATNSGDVVTTIVDGRVLMKDGKVLAIDGAKVKAEADALGAKIKAALAEAN